VRALTGSIRPRPLNGSRSSASFAELTSGSIRPQLLAPDVAGGLLAVSRRPSLVRRRFGNRRFCGRSIGRWQDVATLRGAADRLGRRRGLTDQFIGGDGERRTDRWGRGRI